MHLHCVAGGHAVAPNEVRNQGFGFSHCLRCGQDLVRSNREWRPVPKGFRVAWRREPARQVEVSAAQLFLDLRPKSQALTVIAPHQGAHRAERFAITLLELRYLAWAAGERLRNWWRRLLFRQATAPPIIRLPPDDRRTCGMPGS